VPRNSTRKVPFYIRPTILHVVTLSIETNAQIGALIVATIAINVIDMLRARDLPVHTHVDEPPALSRSPPDVTTVIQRPPPAVQPLVVLVVHERVGPHCPVAPSEGNTPHRSLIYAVARTKVVR
jgi:hypothetical protein